MEGEDWLYIGLGAGALYAIYRLVQPLTKATDSVSNLVSGAADSAAGIFKPGTPQLNIIPTPTTATTPGGTEYSQVSTGPWSWLLGGAVPYVGAAAYNSSMKAAAEWKDTVFGTKILDSPVLKSPAFAGVFSLGSLVGNKSISPIIPPVQASSLLSNNLVSAASLSPTTVSTILGRSSPDSVKASGDILTQQTSLRKGGGHTPLNAGTYNVAGLGTVKVGTIRKTSSYGNIQALLS